MRYAVSVTREFEVDAESLDDALRLGVYHAGAETGDVVTVEARAADEAELERLPS